MGRVSDNRNKLMDAVLELIWTGSYGSTTIDQICDKAEVRKGSFYYYFDSKADLALAAIEAQWQIVRAECDSVFSPTVPPLQRLKNYFDFGYRFQGQMKEKYGCVLGCPLFALGAEVCTQEHGLQKKIQEILGYKLFASAWSSARSFFTRVWRSLSYAPSPSSSFSRFRSSNLRHRRASLVLSHPSSPVSFA